MTTTVFGQNKVTVLTFWFNTLQVFREMPMFQELAGYLYDVNAEAAYTTTQEGSREYSSVARALPTETSL